MTLHFEKTTFFFEKRFHQIRSRLKGFVLDVGCGDNTLLRQAEAEGIGIDVRSWSGVDVVCDACNLPFRNMIFDTVVMNATLNHIPRRLEALNESIRVLKIEGTIVTTMTNPVIGAIWHLLRWGGKDVGQNTLSRGETYGLWSKEVVDLLRNAGFKEISLQPFLFGQNNLFTAKKLA